MTSGTEKLGKYGRFHHTFPLKQTYNKHQQTTPIVSNTTPTLLIQLYVKEDLNYL